MAAVRGHFRRAHRLPPRLQNRKQLGGWRAVFQLGQAVHDADMRLSERLGRVHMPVDRADHRLQHDIRDGVPRAADHRLQPPPRVQHKRRRHRGDRTLAGLHLVVAGGARVERGEGRVQRKATHEQPGSERPAECAGHADGVALGVHDGDRGGALGDDRLHLRRHGIRLGAIFRLDQQARRVRPGRIQRGQVEIVQPRQRPQQHCAAARRRRAADRAAVIGLAGGITPANAVGGEIVRSDQAGALTAAHGGGDLGGDRAAQQCVGAVRRNGPQRLHEIRVGQDAASRERRTLRGEEGPAGAGLAQQSSPAALRSPPPAPPRPGPPVRPAGSPGPSGPAHGRWPCSRCSASSIGTRPGTPTACPPDAGTCARIGRCGRRGRL